MARLVRPSMPNEDEGYPVPRTVDGVDTKRVANREGAMRHIGRFHQHHTEWTNSKTGKRTEPPEYASDDDC